MNERIKENNFGLPIVSYDPVKTIGMEGQVFRNITDPKIKRSLFVRIMSIFLFSFLFLLPGLGILFSAIYEIVGFVSSGLNSNDGSSIYVYIIGFPFLGLVGLFFIAIALKVIKSNI